MAIANHDSQGIEIAFNISVPSSQKTIVFILQKSIC